MTKNLTTVIVGGCENQLTEAFDTAYLAAALPPLVVQIIVGYVVLVGGSTMRGIVLAYQGILAANLFEAFVYGIAEARDTGFSPFIVNRFLLSAVAALGVSLWR